MEILIISLVIILINTIITVALLNCLADSVLERFKSQDEFDETVVKNFKVISDELKLKYKISKIESNNQESEEM